MDRVELRTKIRENKDVVWGRLKAKFATRAFPEREIEERITSETVKHYEAFHYTAEKEKHRVTRYSYYEPMYEFFGIDWSYDYCPTCKKTFRKMGTLTSQLDNEAIQKPFDENIPVAKPVARPTTEDLISIFDGGLEVNIYD